MSAAPPAVVDRCVCFDVTFDRLKEFASVNGGGLDAITAKFGCGRGCAMCVPFIRAMLQTGLTRLPADLANLRSGATACPTSLAASRPDDRTAAERPTMP